MENNTQNVNVETEVNAAPETAAPANDFVAKAKDFALNIFSKAKDFALNIFSKIKADPKGFGVKLGAIALAAILVIVGLCVGVSAATNNYKTPIKTMQKYANMKKYYDSSDKQMDLLNGFAEKESKALMKVMKASELYDDENLDDLKEDFKDQIEDMKDEYGKNFKYTYKIVDKEKLDRDELKEYREELRDYADALDSQIEAADDFDSDDWEDMADSMGLSKSKAKKYYSILKDVQKVYKKAKVTAGYTLTVEITLTGSELDEPEVKETEIVVLKVNGRWIPASAL